MIQKLVKLITVPENAKEVGQINKLTLVDDDPDTPHDELHIRSEPWIVSFDENNEYVLILKGHFPDATKVTVFVGEQGISFNKQSNDYFGGLRHIYL